MRRRDFINGIAGSAAAWPLAARAQQADRMRRIGVLMSGAADDPVGQAEAKAFQQGLQQLGWTDGRNVRIDYRWAAGTGENSRKYAVELVALAPDVILAVGGATGPVLQATRTVPIVFTVTSDPVGSGFVDSLSRPGRNATGFMLFEYSLSAKWVELLKQIAPGVTRAAVLRDPELTSGIGQFSVIQYVAPSVGVEVSPINIRADANEIERAVTAFARAANGALIVATVETPAHGGKWVELLKEIAPRTVRVALLFNPATAVPLQFFMPSIQAAASSLAIQISNAPVHAKDEIEGVIAAQARNPGGGLIVMPDTFNVANREPIIALAARYGVPAIYWHPVFTESGGLIIYGTDFAEQFRQVPEYIDRILKGEKPADLPIQAPTKFELVINLKAAKALDLDVPPLLLGRADEVIE
jgi:ABC-type uncharacterized transport system substrate-binding protein